MQPVYLSVYLSVTISSPENLPTCRGATELTGTSSEHQLVICNTLSAVLTVGVFTNKIHPLNY